ncbi:MAG: DsbA family protein [Alphaproteobacteria bacterium]|jgi:2-hydroxychromene-2-carboxylate isomerase|nr:DsbA family protein [Alphaproteobacteria bacterium]MDP6818041.1 DsbA family protein [Alphaproteobacteria bacterium]|tara:strand:- start:840 stop:1493 length:654 start_codon:yes stop_codon:yes gene_type:complete
MPHKVEIFYSFRSPYCYLLTDRLTSLARDFEVAAIIRPVYPIAIRDAEFFRRVDPLYRPYHLKDSARLAEFLNIPYRRPVPDPIVQDLASGEIATEQPYIRHITRMAQAAADIGAGVAYSAAVMALLWNGATDNWHQGSHLADACGEAGLDFAALDRRAAREAAGLDAEIDGNQQAQRAAGHWGVPLMVFDGEPFYGQDRFDMLCWRLSRHGLSKSN